MVKYVKNNLDKMKPRYTEQIFSSPLAPSYIDIPLYNEAPKRSNIPCKKVPVEERIDNKQTK